MLSIKKTFGFSLIELLVAITIMAVMSGIALSSYQSSIIKSKRKAALSVLFQITAQQEEYFVNNKNKIISIKQVYVQIFHVTVSYVYMVNKA